MERRRKFSPAQDRAPYRRRGSIDLTAWIAAALMGGLLVALSQNWLANRQIVFDLGLSRVDAASTLVGGQLFALTLSGWFVFVFFATCIIRMTFGVIQLLTSDTLWPTTIVVLMGLAVVLAIRYFI